MSIYVDMDPFGGTFKCITPVINYMEIGINLDISIYAESHAVSNNYTY